MGTSERRRLTAAEVGANSRPPAGGVPEWLKGTDCKSVGLRLRWFKSNPLHQPQHIEIIYYYFAKPGDFAPLSAPGDAPTLRFGWRLAANRSTDQSDAAAAPP